jgi:pilus assembly protein Flp/PilA
MREIFCWFLRDGRGATSIEYALIATMVALGLIVGLNYFTDAMNGMFNGNASTIGKALTGA